MLKKAILAFFNPPNLAHIRIRLRQINRLRDRFASGAFLTRINRLFFNSLLKARTTSLNIMRDRQAHRAMSDEKTAEPAHKTRSPLDRRTGIERRSDVERRVVDAGPPAGVERRFPRPRRQAERRSGLDRRQARKHLQAEILRLSPLPALRRILKRLAG